MQGVGEECELRLEMGLGIPRYCHLPGQPRPRQVEAGEDEDEQGKAKYGKSQARRRALGMSTSS